MPSYSRETIKKMEKLLQNEPESKIKNYEVQYQVKKLEKLIHTLQEDFSHCFHQNLKNPSTETTIYFKHYELLRFKKLSEEAYRIYKSLSESNLSYKYDENYDSSDQFDELMKREFTIFCIPYYKIFPFRHLWFYTVEKHMPKIVPEEEKLTYNQIISSIPKALVMIEFDILAAEIVKLESYVKKRYLENHLLHQEIQNILIKIKQCRLSFKQSGKFNKTMFENIHHDLSIIYQHRGVHNRETHPIFNKIIDALRLIMSYLTEFLTLPIKYCLPKIRENIVNFFSEPKTYSQKVVEHFLEEADMFMGQANRLNLEQY